jgi:dihydroorotate dehydrogenase electron transfer subunit
MYWGRKPINDLVHIFEELKSGDIVLDPFCGGGNPALAALINGGRVIAGDLNPMAVFLTNVLIRPINLNELRGDFENIANKVSGKINQKYAINCPDCRKLATIDYLVWTTDKSKNECWPEAVYLDCKTCGKRYKKLSASDVKRQIAAASIKPQYWFPKNVIHSVRNSPVKHFYELFTRRNLSMLSELHHAIKQVSSQNSRDALFYIFTAMLYSCSNMQMFSEKEPSSSRGWQALRFYVPPKRKEVNVWHAFERRFGGFISCKRELNGSLQRRPSIQITDSLAKFNAIGCDVLIDRSDAFDLIRRVGKRANFVFMDPPYVDDIDYFGFSEFWGAWLQMHFDFDREWQPRRAKAKLLKKLLLVVKETTSDSCSVCLALAPKDDSKWNEEDCIKESKYYIERKGFFNYDNSNKRASADDKSNRYSILVKNEPNKPIIHEGELNTTQQLLPYLRIADCLYPRDKRSKTEPVFRKTSVYDNTRKHAAQLAPDSLSRSLKNITDNAIKKAISKKGFNEKTYHSLCYALVSIVLIKDKYKAVYVDPTKIEENVFGVDFHKVNCVRPADIPEGIAFVFQNDGRKLLFCFDDQHERILSNIAREVSDIDKGKFRAICVMIVRDVNTRSISKMMKSRRRVSRASEWQRGFFLSFPELGKKAEEINKEEYLKLGVRTPEPEKPKPSLVKTVMAEVKSNIPVGAEKPSHFKLRFITDPRSFNIIPGQFIMMATSPPKHNQVKHPHNWHNVKLNITPTAYLKRPFGIHRAFYPHFGEDYLKELSLPPELATVLHTVYPNSFEIFYKRLENGIGTNELSELKKGDKVEIIGPLGNRERMREVRGQGFEEVHVIGGGVGMAPLIFMVQALKYYSHSVKVFIGTENIGMLKYSHQDGLDQSFDEASKDATIYINDLLEIGIDPKDIRVSTNTPDKIDMIPESNQYQGLVTDQYHDYLKESGSQKKILAFTCGPTGMMKALVDITIAYGITLKVLMEKRMACGIGVCLSCVCETKTGEGNYSRVCTDGPVFDASEIIW